MAVNIGSKGLAAAYAGNKAINEIYRGNTLIWPEKASGEYTYGYTGEYQLSAKAYYVDSSGNLLDEPVPASGGTAVLVPTYVIGLIRYLDGIEVDRPNLETGAVLESVTYQTFDVGDWGDNMATDIRKWTHTVNYSTGSEFINGSSFLEAILGEAPSPYFEDDNAFDAVHVTGLSIRIPAGTMNGLEERVFTLNSTVAIQQYLSLIGNATKYSVVFEDCELYLNDMSPNPNASSYATLETDPAPLSLRMVFFTETLFDSGITVQNFLTNAFEYNARLSFEDHVEFGIGLQPIYFSDYENPNSDDKNVCWPTILNVPLDYIFSSSYRRNFSVYLQFYFEELPTLVPGNHSVSMVVRFNEVEYNMSDGGSAVFFPWTQAETTWRVQNDKYA